MTRALNLKLLCSSNIAKAGAKIRAEILNGNGRGHSLRSDGDSFLRRILWPKIETKNNPMFYCQGA
jgi:hypothetical protein